jgi:hypothetical protein
MVQASDYESKRKNKDGLFNGLTQAQAEELMSNDQPTYLSVLKMAGD